MAPPTSKIIAALGEQPNHLITSNPNVKTLKDFDQGRQDRTPGSDRLATINTLLEIAAERNSVRASNTLDELDRHSAVFRCDGGAVIGLRDDIGRISPILLPGAGASKPEDSTGS